MNYQAKLENMPPSGGGGAHGYILGIANTGIFQGIHPDQIVADIRAVWHGTRDPQPNEIEATVQKALGEKGGWTPSKRTTTKRTPATLPLVTPETTTAFIERGRNMKPDRSNIPSDPIDQFELFMRATYQPDEFVFMGTTLHNGQIRQDHSGIATVESHIATARSHGLQSRAFTCPNRYTGQLGTKKDGGMSLRCDDAIINPRFVLAEFDNLSLEDQLAFWLGSGIPIHCLIYSGSKSIHAWLPVTGITTPEQWKAQVKGQLFGQVLIPLGLDPTTSNPSRLSRTVGHVRDTGKEQTLIYLAPASKDEKE